MSPKGRKSSSFKNCWVTCEACHVSLTQKDAEQHNRQSCPPNSTDWDYPYVKDGTLYSFVEYWNISDTPEVTDQEKLYFVYMSQSAMQLCHIEIGEQVVLSLTNDVKIIKTAWPTTDRTLTSIVLHPNVKANSKNPCEVNSRVKLHKVSRKPMPASVIQISSCLDLASNNSEHLLMLCKKLYTAKVLMVNSEGIVNYYGKTVNFIIKNIISDKNEDDLTEELQQLSIDTNIDEQIYFIAVEESKWEIACTRNLNDNESKQPRMNHIGGYKEIIQDIIKSIHHVLKKKNNDRSNISNSLGMLLYGPNGVGKTFIAHAIANEMDVHVVFINSGELFSKFYGETEHRLRNLFTEAKYKNPSIIFIDNIDTLCPKRGGSEQEKRVIAYLLTLLDSLKDSRVVVLATTSKLNFIDPTLRRPGRLDCEIEIPVPTVTDRYDILKVILSDWQIEESEIKKMAMAAHGYVAADLQCVVTKALIHATSQGAVDIHPSHLFWALSQIKPSAMREVLVEVPNVKWTDIGGMDDLKLKLQQAIEWPLRHPKSFSRLGITPPRGVLMYGPPGCSKTMIAKALATESKLNFLSIKGSELFSKWVGESEKAVQSLFRKARSVAPSIVFLDELDALGGERSGSGEGNNVQERVVAQLLTEMDGINPLGNVNIVAATNRPDRIDKALLRPGRLDRIVYVPLPDLATRICILQLQLVKMPVANDIVIDDLALKTEGYSGAEIIAVCHEAAMNALQEDFNVPEISEKHFVAALNMVKPRTPLSLIQLYEKYLKS